MNRESTDLSTGHRDDTLEAVRAAFEQCVDRHQQIGLRCAIEEAIDGFWWHENENARGR